MLEKFTSILNAIQKTTVAYFNGPAKNFQEIKMAQESRFEIFSATMLNFNYKPQQIAARKQYWLAQSYFLYHLIKNNQTKFSELIQNKIALENPSDFPKILTELIKALDEREDVTRFLKILQTDSDVLAATINKADTNLSHHPGIHLYHGNIIDLIKSLINTHTHLILNDAPNSHRDGAAKYSAGSVEELLARYTDGWKMVLHFEDVHKRNFSSNVFGLEDKKIPPIDTLDYQQRYLKMMLDIIARVFDKGERYLESKEFLKDLFFSFRNKSQNKDELADNLPIYFGMQNNVYEVPLGGLVSHRVFSDTTNLTNIKSLFENFETINYNPVTVVSFAAPDQRRIETSPLDKRCTSNRLLQHPESEGTLEIMLTKGVNQQCRVAIKLAEEFKKHNINKPLTIIFIMPGCGAFANPPEETALHFFNAIKNNYKELIKNNINCYVAELSATLFETMATTCREVMLPENIPHYIKREKPAIYQNSMHEYKGAVIELRLQNLNLKDAFQKSSAVTNILPDNLSFRTKYHLSLFENCYDSVVYVDVPKNTGEKESNEQLLNSYRSALRSIKNKKIEEAHFILLGTGNLGYSVEQSLSNFLTAIEECVQFRHLPRLVMHIREDQKLYFQRAQTFLNKITTKDEEENKNDSSMII